MASKAQVGDSCTHLLHPFASHISPLATTIEKMKVSTLKEMFWSRPDVCSRYMDHNPLTSSGESSEDDDQATAGKDDDLSSGDSISDDTDDDDDMVSACVCMHL